MHPSNFNRHLRGQIEEARARDVMTLALEICFSVGLREARELLVRAPTESVTVKFKRGLAMHLAHTLGACPISAISGACDMDRTRVRFYLNQIEQRRDGDDKKFDQEVDELERNFRLLFTKSDLEGPTYLSHVLEGVRHAA